MISLKKITNLSIIGYKWGSVGKKLTRFETIYNGRTCGGILLIETLFSDDMYYVYDTALFYLSCFRSGQSVEIGQLHSLFPCVH